MDYFSVEEARDLPGLRLVLTAGVPGPWGESAKAIFAHKGLDFVPVRQDAGEANEALREWTGQTSAPVAVPGEGPPVSHWLDLLHLAERLAPQVPLLPEGMDLRQQAIGLAALIAGVDGFGWQRRLLLFAPGMQADEPPENIARMAAKYGYSHEAAEAAAGQVGRICDYLDRQLEARHAAGSPYFVGDSVTAVDIYWANFAGMMRPLPPEHNPMPDYLRAFYESGDESLQACLTPRLLAHRDLMYERHLALPLDF